jgi:IS30 family transposase
MGAPRLTEAERYQLFEYRLAGLKMTEISAHLGRSRSCLYAELKRGSTKSQAYCPGRGQGHCRQSAQLASQN